VVYLLKLLLLDWHARRTSFLPIAAVPPLPTRGQRRAVLPLQRALALLQLQQVELQGRAAARLEQRRGGARGSLVGVRHGDRREGEGGGRVPHGMGRGVGAVTRGVLRLHGIGRLAAEGAQGLEGGGGEGGLLGRGVDGGVCLVEGLWLRGRACRAHLREHVVGEDQRQDGRDHGGGVGHGVDGGRAGRGLVALAGVAVARQRGVCVGAQAAVGAGVHRHGVAGHHGRVGHGEGGLGGLGERPGGLVQALVEEGGAQRLLTPTAGHGAVRRLNLLGALGLGLLVSSAPPGSGLGAGQLVGPASRHS